MLSYVTSAQVLSVYLSRNDNSSVWAVVGGVLEYNYYIIRKKLKMTHFLKYHEWFGLSTDEQETLDFYYCLLV